MKLTKTHTGSKTLKWNYSSTQIKTTDIKQIRFAIYDNAPDIRHCWEPKRYRGELQIWTSEQQQANYKLFNWMSNYKTFKNCQWKEDNDPYKNWYVREVQRARELNEVYGKDAVISHANLGFPRHHAGRSDGSYGFYNQAQYSMHLLINQDTTMVKVSIEDFEFTEELTASKEIDGATVYWEKFDVS